MVMIVFIGIVAWAYRPKNKGRFEAYGDIPLKDDDQDSSPANPAKER